MRTFKSILFGDDLGTDRLIHNEDEFSGPVEDSQNDRASNFSDYQEAGELVSHTESDQSIAKTESLNSMPELANCDETGCGELNNSEARSFQSFVGEKYEVLTNPEIFLPDSDKSDPSDDMKCWNLLLRCTRVSGVKLPAHNAKIWRPVLVKLEESALIFHAEDFESSPPFKMIDLTWFYSFSVPGIKTKLIPSEFIFTTTLVNTLHTTRGRLAKTRCYSNGVKFGCANYGVLLDFIETVQKCISTFPAFRPAGIFYETEKVFVDIQDKYEVIQQERNNVSEVAQQEKYNVTQVVQQEKHNVVLKQVQIMLKAKVSASPECSVHVKRTESFSKKPAIDDVSFHKCVRSHSLNNRTVTARFLPLDNCSFKLMSWNSCCSKPPPLRCEVTVTVYGYGSLQIHARIFTGSTRLEVRSASDVTLRFYIPSEWLETEKRPAVQTIQHCTDVTKGSVSYNSNAETMLWSIPKLHFNPWRNFYLNGKPLATLNTLLEPPSCYKTRDMIPVEMAFYTKGNPKSSDVVITNMKLGLKSFGKFKTSYNSIYRIRIPVTASIG